MTFLIGTIQPPKQGVFHEDSPYLARNWAHRSAARGKVSMRGAGNSSRGMTVIRRESGSARARCRANADSGMLAQHARPERRSEATDWKAGKEPLDVGQVVCGRSLVLHLD